MKNILFIITLFLGFSAQAKNNETFNFYAEDRFSPVFIEKCKQWRSALQNEDIELALSFLDPDKVKQYPKYAEKHVRKKIRALKRNTSLKGYREISLKIGKKTQPRNASVNIKWEANNGKAIGGNSCTFKELKPKHWRLD